MSAGTLKLEDVQLISEEISWLVRSGLPLEHHLADAGRGHGRRLQKLTRAIADGLQRGESLESLVRKEAPDAPRMLTGAVAAGVQSGDLAASVEMMGDLASDLVDLRQQILTALAYPLIVVACAWLLFVILLQHCLTRIWTAMQGLQIDVHPLLAAFLEFNRDLWWWPWLVPAAGLLVLVVWLASGRASAMAFRGPERILLLLPGVGGLLRDLRFGTLTRMLAFLLEHRVPLPDALRSAGACCGSASLDAACRRVAEDIDAGRPVPALEKHRWRSGRLPPLLHACLQQAGPDVDRFALQLRAVGEQYQSRIALTSLWLKMLMPVVLFFVVAGGTVVAYSISIFWPMTEIFRNLGVVAAPGGCLHALIAAAACLT